MSSRWLDHLPPWLAWGAIASTGVYSGPELGFMAAPLVFAGLTEARRWSFPRWRRLVEFLALAGVLLRSLGHPGLLPTVVTTLFLLCGARLVLPRELPERRQILLMGFLLFLTTAITTSQLDFLFWSLAWCAGAASVLLQQNWERRSPATASPVQAAPFRLILPWTVLMVMLASGFFVILPRLRLGFRGQLLGSQGQAGLQAGLSDFLDPGAKGAIPSSREVALRVLPEGDLSSARRRAFVDATTLLRGIVLEKTNGQRWSLAADTPPRAAIQWSGSHGRHRPLAAELFLEPSPEGILPLPYGPAELEPSAETELQPGRGAAVRLVNGYRRATSFHLTLSPSELEREAPPTGRRLALLTDSGQASQSPLRWSLQVAPGDLPDQVLAQRLAQTLQTTFRYTLDNPSGGTADPLADFLEHSHAGHCEYFASALALMLRQRGVPSRIASGYHLGKWIPEGGYFLVTQDQAHSWVEYYDCASGGWRVADPTPAAPLSSLDTGAFAAALARWTDALRFQWDRHVVRFSDQDQVTSLDWIQARAQVLARWKPRLPGPGLLAGAGVLLVLWALRAGSKTLRPPAGPDASKLRQLSPLLRKLRKDLPPGPGETARAWLGRLARAYPGRASELLALAGEADAVAYAGKRPGALKALVRAELRALAKQPRA